MRCSTCHGTGVRALAVPAFASSGMPFRVFLPEEEFCPHCGDERREEGSFSAESEGKGSVRDDRDYIGTVVAHNSGSGLVSVLLDDSLHTGEKIVVMENGAEREIEVEWMQWGKAWVHLALRGWMVAIPCAERLTAGSKVYRAS